MLIKHAVSEEIFKILVDLDLRGQNWQKHVYNYSYHLRSQINRIKETIDAMLSIESTLSDKIRILF